MEMRRQCHIGHIVEAEEELVQCHRLRTQRPHIIIILQRRRVCHSNRHQHYRMRMRMQDVASLHRVECHHEDLPCHHVVAVPECRHQCLLRLQCHHAVEDIECLRLPPRRNQ